MVKVLTSCVACGNRNLRRILDLGAQPLANEYLSDLAPRTSYPLCLNLCESCTHLQLSVSVNPDILFRNYFYVSSTSKVLSDYFMDLKNRILQEFGSKGYLLDIGSNDGTFISKFNDTEWETLGVDPAANLAPNAAEIGVRTLSAFYNTSAASLLRDNFNVAVAMNVFAHTDNPIEILNALKLNVAESGSVFIQTSQANMIINGEFDTIYHEHISFFNVKSMKALLARAGWELGEVSIVDVHGGSYLWKISRKSEKQRAFHGREEEEMKSGLYDLEIYLSFADRCQVIVSEVKEIVEKLRTQGYKIATYGAAAKGNTFLNFASITPDFIFDDTPLKIGKYSPVSNIVVSNPKEMKNLNDKILFIIPAWNFSTEIKEKISRLRVRSGKDFLLTYFPKREVESL